MKLWTKSETDFLITNYRNYTHKQLAVTLSRTHSAVSERCRYLGLTKRNSRARNETLCWSCSCAAGETMCPWAKSFTPISGWTAAPTIINGNGAQIQSFNVRACPLFIPDRGRRSL